MSEVKRYRAGDFVPVTSVAASDFEAQRLRADTAEANFSRCNGLYYECQKERDTLRSDLAAAEQRTADLLLLIKDIKHCGLFGVQVNGPSIRSRIDAALNPNPEAESHE